MLCITVSGSAHILSLIVQKAPQFIMTNGTKVLESVVSRLDQYVLNEKPCSSVKDPAVHAVDELLNCLWAWGESLAGYSSKIGPILEAVILDEANKDRQILAAQILEKVCASAPNGHKSSIGLAHPIDEPIMQSNQ